MQILHCFFNTSNYVSRISLTEEGISAYQHIYIYLLSPPSPGNKPQPTPSPAEANFPYISLGEYTGGSQLPTRPIWRVQEGRPANHGGQLPWERGGYGCGECKTNQNRLGGK